MNLNHWKLTDEQEDCEWAAYQGEYPFLPADTHLRGAYLAKESFRDTLTGRQQALFDDLQAILRNYGYDEEQAIVALKALTEPEES